MNISVAGIGYVGLSLAVLLSQHNHVYAVDVIPNKVEAIERRQSPIKDELISSFLANRDLDLTATLDSRMAYAASDLVIVAAPTSYDPAENAFDTSHVEEVVSTVAEVNPSACVVIKSTVPVGYTQSLADRYQELRILFSPEFLREGRALYDNLHPSRVIVGMSEGTHPKSEIETLAHDFAKLLDQSACEHGVPTIFMSSTEAEAVKLFANTYLALRVSFFNELDTYAQEHGLDTAKIIEGVGLDARIGSHYNNPSFGYGGYCLPKDTRQLLAEFRDTPQALVSAVVDSNHMRKDFIADEIVRLVEERTPQGGTATVGIWRLTMKTGSDNFRESAILGVIRRLRNRGFDLLVYEPSLKSSHFEGIPVVSSVDEFKQRSTLIVANRWDDDLVDVSEKVFTRDVYGRD